jgi:predicted DNA-binding transcriptional regulator YafY
MRASKRSTRLKELEELLLSKRQPSAIQDLARHFGIHRSTIHRMLRDLETDWDVPIERDANRSVWIDRTRYLTHVKLSLDEAGGFSGGAAAGALRR